MCNSRFADHFRYSVILAIVCVTQARGHEGHQPLPTKGVQVDLLAGHIALSKAARELLDVKTVEVAARDVADAVKAYTRVIAPWPRHAYVTSRLPGRIAKLNIRPGDAVKKGQVLAELDCLALHTLRLDYQKAQSDYELSVKLLESLAVVVEAGAIPGQRLLEAENTHRQNQNAIDVLRAKAAGLRVAIAELDASAEGDPPPLRLALTSPISGVVVHADVAVGKFVEPTEHLLEIVDTSRVWVQIGVLERDLHRVREGQAVRLAFNGLPGQRFDSKVDRLGLMLDPQTHQGTAWTEVDNSARGSRLLPGMNGQAELILSGSAASLTVPLAAVFSDGAERYVLVEETSTKDSSEYRKKSIVIGRRTGDSAEVLSGDIYPGDRVVTRGGHELSSLFFLGVLRVSPHTAKGIGLKVESVSDQSVEQILRCDGAIDIPPQRRTFASSQLAGALRDIRVDRGQLVKAGDILAEVVSLELQDIQLELLQALLDGEMWRETLARRRTAGSAIPRRSLLETESRVKALETQFSNLRQKLLTLGLRSEQVLEIVKTKQVLDAVPIRAPMDGIVVHFDRVLGQFVRADEPLFAIHDLTHAWVQVFLSERDAAQVKVGQIARIRLVAYPDLLATGAVVRLGPVVGVESRTQIAWIEFQDPPAIALQHNMLARVSLVMDHSPPTLAVPLGAVVCDGLRSFVFVRKRDGTFDRRQIEVGRFDDRFLEIQAGLSRGEMIATSGVPQLQTAFSALR